MHFYIKQPMSEMHFLLKDSCQFEDFLNTSAVISKTRFE